MRGHDITVMSTDGKTMPAEVWLHSAVTYLCGDEYEQSEQQIPPC